MALLGRKKKIDGAQKSGEVMSLPVSTHSQANFIIRPRITEKASYKAMNHNAYVFDVAPHANKISVSKAIQELYKVHPVKVSILPVPRKEVFVRGKWGKTKGGKKAYVYLKKGDKIEFV